MKDLDQWLAYIEGLHPKNIDMGLERVRVVWSRIKSTYGVDISCPVITVAGTNGKGSTCAMLESVYSQAGYKTGVYSSPHLVHFLERCRIRNESASATDFIAACADVESARCQKTSENEGDVSLTYFEFTTLAFLLVMCRAAKAGQLDVMILEVGLGGRLDAVNIIDTDCAVITSIDLDHMEYLGPDRESIGREKAGIMRAGKPVIVSDPMPPQSVIDHAEKLGADLWRMGTDFNFQGDKQQWGWAGRAKRFSGLAYPALRGANQLINASGVLAAITAMNEQLPITAQAVRNGMAFVELPGRFQIVPGQPALVLDVAHNPHSVAALTANLDAMGFYPTTHAVFGAMADKDLTPMLLKLAPIVDRWYFTDLPTARAAKAFELQSRWKALNTRSDAQSSVYTSPQEALDAAVAAADAADRIVVFGSFYTVGGVLQNGTPRLEAKHLSKT
ncbi:bifunctional tetrahydrofolate synthase/dihydrofolate synthase [Variovorax sp. PCZ-1]|uniref:bifunctional tetrahydrofolate synthase/dihydrofolate synthase n=1 Tax=Variovorax sp. PCZ-1 TaxID=2835533 RepID=UPI001BCD7C93|nr:bifunctional tetrahydrofolate synthase/dihydrofolate synthase [Variovorax sp. PCZ-1]MBS7806556.1 bifunctional tetrahydrofolate synthase/dihydrofolate synthase [Variovorax sp. PCZ-1]